MRFPTTTTSGFTLIELIISVGLFAVAVTISVGSLLVLVAQSQQGQADQNTMTNISFALDSMTREIRTGYDYYCAPINNSDIATAFFNQEVLASVNDCPDGYPGGSDRHTGISFIEGGESITGGTGYERIAYWFDLRDTERTIYRRVGNGAAERILSSDIEIVDAEFMVDGTNPNDAAQPTVTIYLEARDVSESTGNTVKFQTTITQRILDI